MLTLYVSSPAEQPASLPPPRNLRSSGAFTCPCTCPFVLLFVIPSGICVCRCCCLCLPLLLPLPCLFFACPCCHPERSEGPRRSPLTPTVRPFSPQPFVHLSSLLPLFVVPAAVAFASWPLPLPVFFHPLQNCHPERSGSRHLVRHAVEGPAVALAVAVALAFVVVCSCCHPERSEGPRRSPLTPAVRLFSPQPFVHLPLSVPVLSSLRDPLLPLHLR